MMFSFLWSGTTKINSFHPCRWDLIARPKSAGGWGLHNITIFNQSLATKSLWRVLTQDGIWHRIIIGKYIFPLSIARWLRQLVFYTSNASPIWRSLLRNLKFIHQWICWKPGSGLEIIVGRDAINGLGSHAFLSQGLLYQLSLSNIKYLYQAQVRPAITSDCTRWLSSSDLGLSPPLAHEWSSYCSVLRGAGIRLYAADDTYLWMAEINQDF
jgi:hypothetical protein